MTGKARELDSTYTYDGMYMFGEERELLCNQLYIVLITQWNKMSVCPPGHKANASRQDSQTCVPLMRTGR